MIFIKRLSLLTAIIFLLSMSLVGCGVSANSVSTNISDPSFISSNSSNSSENETKLILYSPKNHDSFKEGSSISILGKITGTTDYSNEITVRLQWGWGGRYKNGIGEINRKYPIHSDGTFDLKFDIPSGSLTNVDPQVEFLLSIDYPNTSSAVLNMVHVN